MKTPRVFLFALVTAALGLPRVALAHCPLCTVGVGMAALVAVGLGVNAATVGVFVGAFAVALGLWLGRLVPWKIRYKMELFGILSFLLTMIPLLPIMEDDASIYVMWFGDYGSPFQRVYLVDRFLLGGVVGLVMVWIAPFVSSRMTTLRNGKRLPYQGVVTTFILIGLASLLIELTL